MSFFLTSILEMTWHSCVAFHLFNRLVAVAIRDRL
jgi:hypothetical protein